MKINIVRQNALKYKRVLRIRLINRVILVGSLLLFSLSVAFIVSRNVYLNLKINSLNKEIKALDLVFSKRSKEVAEYLAVKQVIGVVSNIQSKRFKYKDFLNGIYKLLPENVKLSTIDFGQTGVVVVSIRLTRLTDYDLLLTNINNSVSDDKFLFSAVSQKSLQRDKSGSYLVSLELRIK